MNRFFMMMLALAALGLTFGACSKDEKAAGDEAAKPAEGDEAAKTEPAKTEPAKTEPAKEEPAKEEPAKEEAAAAGDADSTGIKECDDLIAAYMKCDKMPQAAKDAFMTGTAAWKTAAATPEGKAAAVTSCTAAAEASKASFAALGCE